MAKFIKIVDFNNSNSLSNRVFNSSNDVEVLDFSDDFDETENLSLSGKYVDDEGKSFPAEYYYDSYGFYNTRYRDGNKSINVKFNVDGSKFSSSITIDDNL